MVQRLGRVNRRGKGEAKVTVVTQPEPKPTKAAESALKKSPGERDKKERTAVASYEDKVAKSRALAKPFDLLPRSENGINVSPGALRELELSPNTLSGNGAEMDAAERLRRNEILAAATSPAPLYPALSRALVDSWSMTSLLERTGRPRIQPWLRGWEVDQDPQTTVIWRSYLPPLPTNGAKISRSKFLEIESFFDAAPPHASEMLETETARVMSWLQKRAELIAKEADSKSGNVEDALQVGQPCAVILEPGGEVRKAGLRVADFLSSRDDKKGSKRLEEDLAGATIVLHAHFRGLNSDGLLDDSERSLPNTLDGPGDWLPVPNGPPAIRFRVRKVLADGDATQPSGPDWSRRLVIPIKKDDEDNPSEFLLVEKWRGEAETADDATAPSEQALDDHQRLTAQKARSIAKRLGLREEYASLLEIAARLHDEGKRCEKWQDAFAAPRDGRPFAKTRGPVNQRLLDGYRHEFGSVPVAAQDKALEKLPEGLRDLALHLITAHHGFGRPIISSSGSPDAPPSILEERAREAASRFITLQRRWGPWGLAWWESLLRAADQQASRQLESGAGKTSTRPSHG